MKHREMSLLICTQKYSFLLNAIYLKQLKLLLSFCPDGLFSRIIPLILSETLCVPGSIFDSAMPSSHYFQLNEIVDLISLTDPGKLLDIGVGFGKYGFLAREYLELWKDGGDYQKWERQIDGIEAFEPYLTPVHKFIYNNVFLGNAIEILPGLKDKYDLILMVDVFEHFTFQDGLKLLGECRKKGKNILISVPIAMSAQEAVYGNEFETHKYGWKKKDFKDIPDKFYLNNSKSIICFIGEDSSRVRKILKKRRIRAGIINLLDFLYLKKAVKLIIGKTR
jgi:SAM-dependent methyltransferase